MKIFHLGKLSFRAGIFLLLVSSVFSKPRSPNIVFILVDDLAWTDLGCYGHQKDINASAMSVAALYSRETKDASTVLKKD